MKQLKTIYFLLTLILLTPMATVSAKGTVDQAHIGTALDQSNQPLNIDTVFSTETEQLVFGQASTIYPEETRYNSTS